MPPYKPEGQPSYVAKYSFYTRNSYKRKISFNLTLNEFVEIATKNCAYCGAKPASFNHYKFQKNKMKKFSYDRAEIKINGIDRIDSSKGYEIGNCAPCCKNCNFAKSKLTVEEFKIHVLKMYTHLFQGKE